MLIRSKRILYYMKTSDKLLIGFSLASLGLFGVLHLTLYAAYKRGDAVDAKTLRQEQFDLVRLPQPEYLFLKGTIWVNIFPSDSFYVEFPKTLKDPGEGFFLKTKYARNAMLPHYEQSGDTLSIFGNNDMTIHRPFADGPYRESITIVNVYCPYLRGIRIRDGEVMLKGSPAGGKPVAARLKIENSTLWIGEWLGDRFWNDPGLRAAHSSAPPVEYFDSLDIQSDNSIVLLNAAASIHALHIRLDDGSELNDQKAMIGNLEIGFSSDSRVNLTGINLPKAKLSID